MAIDISNRIKKNKIDKLKKVFFRVFVLFSIAAAVFILIYTRDAWYPEMEGILTRVPALPGQQSLAEGNFPLALPEAETVRTRAFDGGFAVLSDTKTAAYGTNGNELLSASHNYANPAISAYENEFVTYDIGGKNFSLYRKGKLRYEKTLAEQILLVRVKNGICGAVTIGAKHPAVLTVYDNTGREIFSFRSTSRITDIAFNHDDSGVFISLLSSKSGDLVSRVVYYSFTETGKDENGTAIPAFESETFGTLTLSLTAVPAKTGEEMSDLLLLVGDRELAVLSSELKLLKQVVYNEPGTLKNYSVNGLNAALLFSDELSNSSTMLIMDSDYMTKSVTIPSNIRMLKATADDYGILALSDGKIDRFSLSGIDISDIPLPGSYSSFIISGDYIFLLGYGEINRLDLPA
ncbi:MAG: DUF5711 family protein [Ruminococcus sp.]|jgi:hypothetical protein|nr:DUF5711 family protein [Ruminococcus sp.]